MTTDIQSRVPDAQLVHRDGPRDSVWLHDGLPEDLARKAPTLLSVDGGYLFLLELSNGGLMLCASNKPATIYPKCRPSAGNLRDDHIPHHCLQALWLLSATEKAADETIV